MNSLPDPSNLVSFLPAVISAISSHQLGLVLALGVSLLVFLLRKFSIKVSPKLDSFVHTDLGGALLALLTAFAAALAAGGGALSGAVFLVALKTAIGAMGGFSFLVKLIVPLWKLIFPDPVLKVEAEAAQQAAKLPTGKAATDLSVIK